MARGLPETVLVGRILKPHGLRGEVIVEVLSDVEERFAPGAEVVAGGPGGGTALRVAGCRPFRGGLLVHFDGRPDRTSVEDLAGRELVIAREAVPAAPAGTFYYFELMGCRCSDRTQGDLGVVTDVVEDGGGLLLEVRGDAGGKVLVPFVSAFVEQIDIPAGTIELDLPPGLVETCASK